MSRIERFRAKADQGEDPPELNLPAIEAADHLVPYLFRVGPGADGKPITFAEMLAWADLTGVALDSWESETLRGLSVSYMAEYVRSSDPQRPPPYIESVPIRATDVSSRLKSVFASFRKGGLKPK